MERGKSLTFAALARDGTARSGHGGGGAGGPRCASSADTFFGKLPVRLLLILMSLTGVMWIAVALRQLELMTTQGQDALRFLRMTTLAIPAMMALIAPIGLLIAAIHVLNRLNSDSELIVMTAGGMPPWSLLKPLACWRSGRRPRDLGGQSRRRALVPAHAQGPGRAGAHRPDGPGHPALAVHLAGGQAHGSYPRPRSRRRSCSAC